MLGLQCDSISKVPKIHKMISFFPENVEHE